MALKKYLSASAWILWCLLLAFLVRWPVSYYLWALPADLNFPLHVLAAKDIFHTGDLFHIQSLSFPHSIPFRIVAWPVVLLAVLLQVVWSPVSAFNLATVLSVAMQGMAIVAWGASRGWSWAQRTLAAAVLETAPVALAALANSQYENLPFFSFCLVAWGLLRPGRTSWPAVAAGLFTAGFASPYQAIPALILAATLAAFKGAKTFAGLGLVAGISLLPAAAYYAGAVTPQVRPGSGPMVNQLVWDKAYLGHFLTPARHTMAGGDAATLADLGTRWKVLTTPPPAVRPDRRLQVSPLWPEDYLGTFLVVAGLLGLWTHRKEHTTAALFLAGLLAAWLSLGPHAGLFTRLSNNLDPDSTWSILLRPIFTMKSPVRFLTLTTFVLVIGIVQLVRRWPPILTALFGLILVTDALVRTPGYWPVRAVYLDARPLLRVLPPGPIAVWPPFHPQLICHYQALSVATERRLALCEPVWSPNHVSMPELWGGAYRSDRNPDARKLLATAALPSQGRPPAAWLRTVHQEGVRNLVEILAEPEAIPPETHLPQDLLAISGAPRCLPGFCVWDLDEQLDDQTPTSEPPLQVGNQIPIRCR